MNSPVAITCDCGYSFLDGTGGQPKRSPLDWYLEGYRRSFTFAGRATPAEYWSFLIISAVVGFALSRVDVTLEVVYGLASFSPTLAVTTRRLHDSGRSGWFLCVPVAGTLFLLASSEPRNNRFGPRPKH